MSYLNYVSDVGLRHQNSIIFASLANYWDLQHIRNFLLLNSCEPPGLSIFTMNQMTIRFQYCNTSLQLFLLLMRSLCCAKFASKQRLTWRVTLGQLIVWSWEAVIVSSISAISGDQVKVDSSAGVCSTSLVTRHAGGEWKHWTCCITRHMDSDILRISVW